MDGTGRVCARVPFLTGLLGPLCMQPAGPATRTVSPTKPRAGGFHPPFCLRLRSGSQSFSALRLPVLTVIVTV